MEDLDKLLSGKKNGSDGQKLENMVQQMLEDQRLEGNIIDYIKHNPEVMFVVGKVNPAMAYKIKNSRIIGMPDFEVYLNKGYCFFIECKFGEGRETDIQKQKFEHFKKNGFNVFICKNIIDVYNIVSYIKTYNED